MKSIVKFVDESVEASRDEYLKYCRNPKTSTLMISLPKALLQTIPDDMKNILKDGNSEYSSNECFHHEEEMVRITTVKSPVNELTVNDSTINDSTVNDLTVNDSTVNDLTVNDLTVNDSTIKPSEDECSESHLSISSISDTPMQIASSIDITTLSNPNEGMSSLESSSYSSSYSSYYSSSESSSESSPESGAEYESSDTEMDIKDPIEMKDMDDTRGISNEITNDAREMRYQELRNMRKLKNLVIGGGGTAGYCYVAAVTRIFEEYDLRDIKNLIGTSIGSVIVTLLSLTDDTKFLKKAMDEFDMAQLRDNSKGLIRNTYRIYKKLGNYKGEYMIRKMKSIFEEVTGDPNLTFAKHYEITGKNLIITGVNILDRKTVYFNRLTHPDLEIALAIRASTSLPLVFVPIEIKHHKFRKIFGRSGMYIDGGISDNYPINFIFTTLYELLNITGTVTDAKIYHALFELYNYTPTDKRKYILDIRKKSIRMRELSVTLGMKTYSDKTMSNVTPDFSNIDINDETYEYEYSEHDDDTDDTDDRDMSLKKYVSNIISTLMDNGLKKTMESDILKRTIAINVGNLSTTKLKMSDELIKKMYDLGARNAEEYLNSQSI